MNAVPQNSVNAAPQQSKAQISGIDIIRNDFQSQNPGMTFDKFQHKLLTVIKNPNNKLVRYGNTVFLLMKKTPELVELHTFTQDNVPALVKNFQDLAKSLKNMGIKTVMTYADSPAYLKVAQATGLPVKTGQSTKVIKGAAKPVYTFTLDLK